MILGLGRSPGEGNGNPLQYSCLENPMHRRAWWGLKESDMTERLTLYKSWANHTIEFMHLFKILYGLNGYCHRNMLHEKNQAINSIWCIISFYERKNICVHIYPEEKIALEYNCIFLWASQVVLVVKNPPANTRDSRDTGSIPGS